MHVQIKKNKKNKAFVWENNMQVADKQYGPGPVSNAFKKCVVSPDMPNLFDKGQG